MPSSFCKGIQLFFHRDLGTSPTLTEHPPSRQCNIMIIYMRKPWLSDRLRTIQEAARFEIGKPIPMKLTSSTLLFKVPSGLIRILDRDLVAAGIALMTKHPKTGKLVIDKRDDRGRTVDVHALRTTFGTHLSKGGVSLRTAQAAMRHSKPDLTANVYTDPKLLDVAGALNALPLLSLNPPEKPQSGKATGTDGAAHQNSASAIALPIAPATGQTSIFGGTAVQKSGKSGRPEVNGEMQKSAIRVNKNGSQSTLDYEPSFKRAKGFEPSTFTLAT